MRASAASNAARSPPSSTLPNAVETTARGQGAEFREPLLSSPKAPKETRRGPPDQRGMLVSSMVGMEK